MILCFSFYINQTHEYIFLLNFLVKNICFYFLYEILEKETQGFSKVILTNILK